MTLWRIRIACCITKTTNTHSEYVILIVFLLQQWLHERESLLGYAYIACIFKFIANFYSFKLYGAPRPAACEEL
jgi:hypothetical protein